MTRPDLSEDLASDDDSSDDVSASASSGRFSQLEKEKKSLLHELIASAWLGIMPPLCLFLEAGSDQPVVETVLKAFQVSPDTNALVSLFSNSNQALTSKRQNNPQSNANFNGFDSNLWKYLFSGELSSFFIISKFKYCLRPIFGVLMHF